MNVHRKVLILLLGLMVITTGGCTGDSLNSTKQLSLSTTPPVETTSYTSKVTTALGSYYDNTVTFLTEDCGAGAYTTATGKALFYGVGGGLWGASAAVSAVMGMAKLHGLDVNKHEHRGSGKPIEVNDISQAEKARVIAAALAEAVNG